MTEFIDYYNILQVHHDAEKNVIDAAYRCLSKMYHPDVNKAPPAAERMKEINAAYGVIGDEKARREYHRQWMGRNAWKTLSEWGTTGWRVTENKEAYSAFEMLDAFFRETLNENWEEAYRRLTEADRTNVGFGEFLEWKQAVHSVYRLGNYHISYFRRYDNCRYGGNIYPQIFHFIVKITELQQITGRITESSSHKYVALDKGFLRVCLGSRDLKPSIEKFTKLGGMFVDEDFSSMLIRAANRIDPGTGVLTRSGLTAEAERELQRSRRYGRSFCMGVISFTPQLSDEGDLHGEDTLEQNMAYVSRLITGQIRSTDSLGRCSDLAVGLIFPETKPARGKKAMEKVVALLEGDAFVNENFPCKISAAVLPCQEDVEEELELLLRQVGVIRAVRPEV
jgi:curved DNA-binding protein CbpA